MKQYQVSTIGSLFVITVPLLFQNCSKVDFSSNSFKPDTTNTITGTLTSDVSVKITKAPKALEAQNAAAFEFEGQVSDGSPIKKYSCKVDGKDIDPCTSSLALSALGDGNHKFEVTAFDQNDKSSAPASHDWIVDTVGPIVTIVSGPKKITNQKNATLVYTINDGVGSGVGSLNCTIDGVAISNCDSVTLKKDFINLPDGSRIFTIQAIDKAGNKSNVAKHDWLIDSVLPTLVFTMKPGNLYSTKNIKFSFEAKDEGSGVEAIKCKIDNGTLKVCTTSDFYTLDDNKHSFYAVAYDFAGNESLPLTHDLQVDSNPPTVTITDHPNVNANSKDAKFGFVGNDGTGSGIYKYQCKLDATVDYSDCTSPINYSNLTEGDHDFYVLAIDNANHASTPATWKWKVDVTPPKINFTKTPSNPTTDITALFQYTISENGSGVDTFKCTLDGKDYSCPTLGMVSITNLSTTNHSFTVTATDKSGNQGSSTYSWAVQGSAPPPLVTTPGVVTILLALGDKDNLPNPTVDQVSARTVAEKMVQYASPVQNPKVLVVLDSNHNGESPDDFPNLYNNLLINYKPDHMEEPASGLTAAHIANYDVVWLVNPGYEMGSLQTKNTLKAFKGGVILSGDDMTQGKGFNNSDLTGLTYVDNGTNTVCGGTQYQIDDNVNAATYTVTLDGAKFPDLVPNHVSFSYGNDIDNSTARAELEVLAYAKASPGACTDKRPVIARYPKK